MYSRQWNCTLEYSYSAVHIPVTQESVAVIRVYGLTAIPPGPTRPLSPGIPAGPCGTKQQLVPIEAAIQILEVLPVRYF